MSADALPGAPLDAAQLEAMLDRNVKGKGYPMDVPDLVAEVRRLRSTVARAASDLAIVDNPDAYSEEYFAEIVAYLRAALAAPGAREETTP